MYVANRKYSYEIHPIPTSPGNPFWVSVTVIKAFIILNWSYLTLVRDVE
jgi:hypothetical protein